MKDLQQQVAYLQGLAEGIEVENSKEGKLILEMLDVLEAMAEHIAGLSDEQADLEDYLEAVDSDLSDLEEDFYNDEECCCDDEDDDYVEVECPECHEEVCFDSDILYDEDLIEVTCPSCGAVVFCNDECEDFDDDDEEEADKVVDIKEEKKEKKQTKKSKKNDIDFYDDL